MREIYRREKRKIQFYRWVYMVIVWCIYLVRLMADIPSPYSIHYEERKAILLPFKEGWLIFIGIFLLLIINNVLFFIQEQGKQVYVMEKYIIVPIHKKKLYNLRVRIFLETIVCFVIGACGIYTVVTIANDCIFSPLILFLSAIKLFSILVILMILILVFGSFSQERQFQKK